MRSLRWLLLAFSLLLAGCENQVLYSDLTESEANEMIARLYASNLEAEKLADKSGSFKVETRKSTFSAAVAVLQMHGLPRERFESLGDVFEKDGFVSSPLEERARLNYALSQEIARTISNIDGVVLARVHLAVPKREHLAKTVSPSSASVFVKHRASVDLAGSVGKIKSMVVTGFENLPYENVTVSLFPAEEPAFSVEEKPVDTFLASFGNGSLSSILMMLVVLLGTVLLTFGIVSLFRPQASRAQEGRAQGKGHHE